MDALTDAPVAIVDLDLAHPLADVEVDARHRGAYVVVRLHGAPLGVVRLRPEGGRLSAAVLRAEVSRRLGGAIVHRLARLAAASPPARTGAHAVEELLRRAPDAGAPGHRTPGPTISVAVCTRDRPEQLVGCLRSLARLRHDGLDVVVVDNAPRTDATRALVCGEFARFRYVREDTPGLDWARNRAIAESRGEVVAYLDDDTVVDPGWATAVARAFAGNPEVAAMTGLVLPLELETEAQLLFESNNHGFGRGFARRWVHATRTALGVTAFHGDVGVHGTGANMAFRRSFLAEVGGFDPALDVGTETDGGGDLDMLFRVLKHRRMLVYDPDAVVWHLHRRGYDELVSQVRGWGSGMSAYLARTVHAYPDERIGRRILELRKLARWFGGRFAASFVTPRFRRELVFAELNASFTGAARYERARERANVLAMERARSAADPAVMASVAAPVATSRARAGVGPGSATPSGATPSGVARATLELADPPAPLTDVGGVARVRLGVTSRGRPLGEVTVPVCDGAVGAERMRDAVARTLGPELLGVSPREARDRVARFLQRTAR